MIAAPALTIGGMEAGLSMFFLERCNEGDEVGVHDTLLSAAFASSSRLSLYDSLVREAKGSVWIPTSSEQDWLGGEP